MKKLHLFLALVFFLTPIAYRLPPVEAASGCSYPASLDTFADKAAGDNLTQGDLNARTCAIEKLEAGPIRPNKATTGAPAYSFQGDTDTGIDSLGANQVSLIAGGAEIATATSSQLAPASGKHIVASKNNCAALNEFVQNDGTCAGHVGLAGSIGQDSKNNAANPNNQFDLSAGAVMLRNSSSEVVVRYNPSTVTVDVNTAGSAANGRDQAGAFSASSWVHLYWIWNGTTLASLASATAPPTGPTLPSGYTHWSYAGAVRYDATPNLVKSRIKNARVFYESSVSALSAGAATTETTVSVSALVPPNASQYSIYGSAAPSNLNQDLKLRVVTGSDFQLFDTLVTAASLMAFYAVTLPNVSQQFFYLWTNAPNVGVTLSVTSYDVPNGGV